MGQGADHVNGACARIAVQAHIAFAIGEAAGLHRAEFGAAGRGQAGRGCFIAGKGKDQSLHARRRWVEGPAAHAACRAYAHRLWPKRARR